MTRAGLARASALCAAVAAAAALTSGCSQGGSASASIIDRVNAWTVPGVLRIEAANIPDNLNPLLGQESIDTDLSMFWAGHLFNWSDDSKLIPELATEVPTVANGGISREYPPYTISGRVRTTEIPAD